MDELKKAMTETPKFSVTGRRLLYDGPALQNIPTPRTEVGNYFIQARAAAVMGRVMWQRYMEEGWVEVAPGILRHPNKPNMEVDFG